MLPGLEIDRIEYPQLQKEIRSDADAKKEQVLPGHAGPTDDRQGAADSAMCSNKSIMKIYCRLHYDSMV